MGYRVRLRPLDRADLERTLAWRNREDSRKWFVHAETITWGSHLAWYDTYAERDDDFVFVVEDLDQEGRSVGQVALYRVDWERGEAEFGRLLIGEPAARGKGLGRDVTSLLVGFGFERWGLNRIHLEVFRTNARAIQIYEALGFEIVTMTDSLIEMELAKTKWVVEDMVPAN